MGMEGSQGVPKMCSGHKERESLHAMGERTPLRRDVIWDGEVKSTLTAKTASVRKMARSRKDDQGHNNTR